MSRWPVSTLNQGSLGSYPWFLLSLLVQFVLVPAHSHLAVWDARAQVLGVLCAACEYDELPVRHNEDKLNAALAQDVRLRVDPRSVDDPHTKANLLLQACSPLAKAAAT